MLLWAKATFNSLRIISWFNHDNHIKLLKVMMIEEMKRRRILIFRSSGQYLRDLPVTGRMWSVTEELSTSRNQNPLQRSEFIDFCEIYNNFTKSRYICVEDFYILPSPLIVRYEKRSLRKQRGWRATGLSLPTEVS